MIWMWAWFLGCSDAGLWDAEQGETGDPVFAPVDTGSWETGETGADTGDTAWGGTGETGDTHGAG